MGDKIIQFKCYSHSFSILVGREEKESNILDIWIIECHLNYCYKAIETKLKKELRNGCRINST